MTSQIEELIAEQAKIRNKSVSSVFVQALDGRLDFNSRDWLMIEPKSGNRIAHLIAATTHLPIDFPWWRELNRQAQTVLEVAEIWGTEPTL